MAWSLVLVLLLASFSSCVEIDFGIHLLYDGENSNYSIRKWNGVFDFIRGPQQVIDWSHEHKLFPGTLQSISPLAAQLTAQLTAHLPVKERHSTRAREIFLTLT